MRLSVCETLHIAHSEVQREALNIGQDKWDFAKIRNCSSWPNGVVSLKAALEEIPIQTFNGALDVP